MNNRNLIIVFVALLLVYAASQLFFKKKTRSFTPDIVQIDTAKVDQITFYEKGSDALSYQIEKKDGVWRVKNDSVDVSAETSAVRRLIDNLNTIKAQRIVAKAEDKWPDYEVDAAGGRRITVSANGKTQADLILGRFNFNQQTRSATSYVRMNDAPDTYAVDGFLSMSLNQSMSAYRNTTMLKLNRDNIAEVRLITDSLDQKLLRSGNQWQTAQGIPVDSSAMAAYLNGIQTVTVSDFVDDFNPATASKVASLVVAENTGGAPITIDCYRNPNAGGKHFVLGSSQNQEAYFGSDSTGIVKRMFQDVDVFKPIE